jgi:hypothetical protein
VLSVLIVAEASIFGHSLSLLAKLNRASSVLRVSAHRLA